MRPDRPGMTGATDPTGATDDPAGASGGGDPPRLEELTWTEAAAWFHRNPRLILPVGSCVPHGPHLPVNTDTLIVRAVCEAIGAAHGVLVAPTFPFGAASERDEEYAGTCSIGPKTLHRVLNELVAVWESHGIREFFLVTAYGWTPHFGAILTVVTELARLRALDLNAVDLSPVLGVFPPPERAGEVETSLILHLAPHLVRESEIEDAPLHPSELEKLLEGTEPLPPPGSPGVVGTPTAASAEKGRAIYEHLVQHVGERLFGDDAREPAG